MKNSNSWAVDCDTIKPLHFIILLSLSAIRSVFHC